MSISVTELRSGTTFIDQDKIFKVLKYEHVKMGRGSATVRVRVKDLRQGAITERTYLSGQKLEEASLRRAKTSFLYQDNQGFHFMDLKTFDQFLLPKENLTQEAKFLREGLEVEILFFQNEPLELSLPTKLSYKVVKSAPGIKGDSATNIFKEVMVETGMTIKAPLFIEKGDEILVDTRSGEYLERTKSEG
jgi:elongation factor P